MENIDWGGLRGGEWTRAVDVGRGQDGHSCVGDSCSLKVLLEVIDFLGMRVQNSQLCYILDKSLNRQWFESFCS